MTVSSFSSLLWELLVGVGGPKTGEERVWRETTLDTVNSVCPKSHSRNATFAYIPAQMWLV